METMPTVLHACLDKYTIEQYNRRTQSLSKCLKGRLNRRMIILSTACEERFSSTDFRQARQESFSFVVRQREFSRLIRPSVARISNARRCFVFSLSLLIEKNTHTASKPFCSTGVSAKKYIHYAVWLFFYLFSLQTIFKIYKQTNQEANSDSSLIKSKQRERERANELRKY